MDDVQYLIQSLDGCVQALQATQSVTENNSRPGETQKVLVSVEGISKLCLIWRQLKTVLENQVLLKDTEQQNSLTTKQSSPNTTSKKGVPLSTASSDTAIKPSNPISVSLNVDNKTEHENSQQKPDTVTDSTLSNNSSLTTEQRNTTDSESVSVAVSNKESMSCVQMDNTAESKSGNGKTETLKSDTVQSSDGVAMETNSMDDGYQQVENAVLYWHKTTGYYYDPLTQQYYAGPARQSSQTSQDLDPTSYSAAQSSDAAMETSSAYKYSDYERVDFVMLYWHKTTGYYYDPLTQQYYAPSTAYDYQQTSQTTSETSQTSNTSKTTSIADMLAAVSDKAIERSGMEYHDTMGMYFDVNRGLYYDQKSQLYYDSDLGTYFSFDAVTKQYTVHSRVALPEKEKSPEIQLIEIGSSDEEFQDSPEEGEIRLSKRRKIPRGAPPPEDEWAPCIRMVVIESETLLKGALYLVTQDGTTIGREPSDSHGIKVSEVSVSKAHATITYNRYRREYSVKDLGSVNGTFINREERLSEPKDPSKPHPLTHGSTLTIGSTTFLLHMHIGWETCDWCDPSSEIWQSGAIGPEQIADSASLDEQRRKELNRIKKRYGLRLKDTYGEKQVLDKEGYSDRASVRRKTVGSDTPHLSRPDDLPSSVHRPISDDNRGRRMLKKMGWKEGEGLGKDNAGIAEPVKANVRDAKVGLGSDHVTRSLDVIGDSSSVNKAQRMRRRYDAVVIREEKRKQKQ